MGSGGFPGMGYGPGPYGDSAHLYSDDPTKPGPLTGPGDYGTCPITGEQLVGPGTGNLAMTMSQIGPAGYRFGPGGCFNLNSRHNLARLGRNSSGFLGGGMLPVGSNMGLMGGGMGPMGGGMGPIGGGMSPMGGGMGPMGCGMGPMGGSMGPAGGGMGPAGGGMGPAGGGMGPAGGGSGPMGGI
ncbi:hypothetical protein LTS02_009300 [Friedmanniomyces endolithicus]|nr:hypothetical protein LTR75_013318 [Friedmanniomyces endolithicus]KAK0859310.1 hypothetical protein LTS02_009300 [Friedmanniomyces endolithicus]